MFKHQTRPLNATSKRYHQTLPLNATSNGGDASRVSGKCHNLEPPIKDCAICLLIRANYSNFACKFNT